MPGRKRKQQDSTDDAAATATPTKQDEPAGKPPAKMTVVELKKELQDRGLDTSGKKAELAARLEGANKSADSTDTGEAPKAKKQKTEPGMHYIPHYYIVIMCLYSYQG